MRILRALAYLCGGVPLFCAAQESTSDTAPEDRRAEAFTEAVAANLAEEDAGGFGEFRLGGAGFRLADTQ